MYWSSKEESHVVGFRKTNRIWRDEKWKKQLQGQSCSSTNTSGTYHQKNTSMMQNVSIIYCMSDAIKMTKTASRNS